MKDDKLGRDNEPSESTSEGVLNGLKRVKKNIGGDINHSKKIQEGSPADFLQRGVKRLGSTNFGKKVKDRLDLNKK